MKLYALPLTVLVHVDDIREARELQSYIENMITCDVNSNSLFKSLHDVECEDCYQMDIDEAEE